MTSGSFDIELRDISKTEYYLRAKVYYKNGKISDILDEKGRFWPTYMISVFDMERINKHLVLNLQADEENENEDPSEPFADYMYEGYRDSLLEKKK